MKMFLLLIPSFLVGYGKEIKVTAYIKFEYVGSNDKPITNLIIATSEIPRESWEKVIVVDKRLFDKIYMSINFRFDSERKRPHSNA